MNELERPVLTTNHAVMIQKCVKLTQNEEKLSHNKEKLSLIEGKLTNKRLDSIPNHAATRTLSTMGGDIEMSQVDSK